MKHEFCTLFPWCTISVVKKVECMDVPRLLVAVRVLSARSLQYLHVLLCPVLSSV